MSHYIPHFNDSVFLTGSVPDVGATTVIGVVANTTFPNSASNGVAIYPFFNEWGQSMIFGSNMSSNTIDVTEATPSLFQNLTVIHHNAITNTGSGASVDTSNYKYHLFQIDGVNTVNSASQFTIEGSINDSLYFLLHSGSYNTGSSCIMAESFSYQPGIKKIPYMRCNLAVFVAGTWTVTSFHGN